MALETHQAAQIATASPVAIEAAFKRLEPNFMLGRWLSTANKYGTQDERVISRDLKNGAVVRRDLSEYIAASAATHCIDGWTLWGRSIDAHLRGDTDAAKHFAYYASLRGAMSFLATRGIGIFNQDHAIVQGSGTCIKVADRYAQTGGMGTHVMLWDALDGWASLPSSNQHLLEVMRPEGRTLSEWIREFGGSPGAIASITDRWTTIWGLDLLRFKDDRAARNYASYRPSEFNPRQHSSSDNTSKFVRELWQMLEPASSRFEGLDLHVLRLSLQRAFTFKAAKKYTEDLAGYEIEIRRTVTSFFSNPGQVNRITDYLMERRIPGSPTLFSEALKRDPVTHPTQHLQVIARASFLLRLASGSMEVLITNSGVVRSNLTTWLKPFLYSRGIWNDIATTPSPITDLWEDVFLAIEMEEDWHTTNSSSMLDWREAQARAISILGDGERIAAWGWGL